LKKLKGVEASNSPFEGGQGDVVQKTRLKKLKGVEEG
jgi:hypothetical protein